MKVYGTPEYQGFLIQRDPKTKKAILNIIFQLLQEIVCLMKN